MSVRTVFLYILIFFIYNLILALSENNGDVCGFCGGRKIRSSTFSVSLYSEMFFGLLLVGLQFVLCVFAFR